MLYYKVIRDKHDNSLINTMQDLNQMLNQSDVQKQARVNTECFVKLEHTQFSAQNKKAMTLLIILLERKNEILKNLVHHPPPVLPHHLRLVDDIPEPDQALRPRPSQRV